MKYLLKEVKDLKSHCKPVVIEAKNLKQAKSLATRRQLFSGTVLKLYDEYLNLLCFKESNGKVWIISNDFFKRFVR